MPADLTAAAHLALEVLAAAHPTPVPLVRGRTYAAVDLGDVTTRPEVNRLAVATLVDLDLATVVTHLGLPAATLTAAGVTLAADLEQATR